MESMVEKEHVVLQNAEAVQMIHDYMVNPEEHMRHPKRFSNSIIMSLRKSSPPSYAELRYAILWLTATILSRYALLSEFYIELSNMTTQSFLHFRRSCHTNFDPVSFLNMVS